MNFEVRSSSQQVQTWDSFARDDSARVAVGFPSLDNLLRRGGLAQGTFALIAGRTGTRKSTLALNIVANMLKAGHSVGLVGLDEDHHDYVGKLLSVFEGVPVAELESQWGTDGQRWSDAYCETTAGRLHLSAGVEPSLDDLTAWRVEADYPEVMVVDYAALLYRDQYAGQDNVRIPRLMRELQVWTRREGCISIVLHQANRNDDGSSPVALDSLMFGGEQYPDIVWGTWRPSLNKYGRMSEGEALAAMPDGWQEKHKLELYQAATYRVRRYAQSTFVGLLKNRPGTKLCPEGIELVSPDDSMRLVERSNWEEEGVERRKAFA